MISYEHNGHTIYPMPSFNAQSGCWRAELAIRHGGELKGFACDAVFSTQAEAVFHCIKQGKLLIDDGTAMLDMAV